MKLKNENQICRIWDTKSDIFLGWAIGYEIIIAGG